MQITDGLNISNRPFLTIAIPTFNRLHCLRLLVDSIIHQAIPIGVLGEKLEILICNNASTDGTTDYLNVLADIKGVKVIHHYANCGGDANILYCCQAAESKYVWIMGDDDVPLDGALAAILGCLEQDQPDLLYMPAHWVSGHHGEQEAKNKIESRNVLTLNSMELAARATVYVTFISSWVLNLDSYRSYVQPPMLDRYHGTSFTQLEWTLTLLKQGKKLLCAKDDWLIARAGHSGGYSLFEAFSLQYNHIIDEKLADSPELHLFFRRCMLWCFIPGLVWGMRKNAIGNFGGFDKEKALNVLKLAYGNDIFFILIVVPMIKFNKPVAWCFRLAARVLAKLWIYWWRKDHLLQV